MAENTSGDNLFSRWLKKFANTSPEESRPEIDNNISSNDKYDITKSEYEKLENGDVNNEKTKQLEDQRSGVLNSNNQTIISEFNSTEPYDINKANEDFNKIENNQNILDQQNGTLKTDGETKTSIFNEGNVYNEKKSNEKFANNQSDNFIVDQQSGILRSKNKVEVSNFNSNTEYSISKSEESFEEIENDDIIKEQQSGTLKADNNVTRFHEFNSENIYNVEKAEYNSIDAANSSVVDQDKKRLLEDQRSGTLKADNNQTRTQSFNVGNIYNSENSLYKNVEDLDSKEKTFLDNQRGGTLKADNQTRTAEFNSDNNYTLLNADYENLKDARENNGITSAVSIDEFSSAADKIGHLLEQQNGILKAGSTTVKTSEFNFDRKYTKENADLEFISRYDVSSDDVSEVVGSADGSLEKTNNLSDFDEYQREQQEGVLRGSDGITKSADFNETNIYDESKSRLETIDEEADSTASGLNSDSAYILEQRDGLLKSKGNQFYNQSDYNYTTQYPSYVAGENNDTDLTLLWGSEERPALTRGNSFSVLSPYTELPPISNEKISIDLNEFGIGSGTLQFYSSNLSRIFIQKLTNTAKNGFGKYGSFRNFDDFSSLVDKVQDAGLDLGNFGFKDLLRTWIETLGNLETDEYTGDVVGSLEHSRTHESNNKISFFNSNNEYDENSSYYDETSETALIKSYNTYPNPRESNLSEQEITNLNLIAKANQQGYGIGVRDRSNNVQGVFQNWNKDNEYNQNIDNYIFTTNQDASQALVDGNEEYTGVRRRLVSTKQRWAQERFDVLYGKKEPFTSRGTDHLANNTKVFENGQIGTDNIYAFTAGGPNDYVSWFDDVTPQWTEPPSEDELKNLAVSGFNAGQILGRLNTDSQEKLFREKAPEGSSEIVDPTLEARMAIVDSYVPGLTRPPSWNRLPAPLDKELNQNLLLPVETARGFKEVQSVFKELYVNNRSADAARQYAQQSQNAFKDPTVFDNGVLGGEALIEIERSGSLTDNNSGTIEPVFKFEDDDKLLRYESKIQGFINNIPGSVRALQNPSKETAQKPNQVGAELPAVTTKAKKPTLNQNIFDTLARGDDQYFPFLFETENRTAGVEDFEQVCYFQATLDNITEAFNPSWTTKNFFGRTEQVSTYLYTDRMLDISFSIVANTIRELQNLHERVSWLAQQTYGQYETAGNGNKTRLGAGPLVRLTIGDMFSSLPGFIQSLNYNWNFLGAGGKWEMTQGIRIPMGCKVNLSYKVMHDKLPDRNYSLYSGPLRRSDGLIRRGNGPAKALIETFSAGENRNKIAGAQGEEEMYVDYNARNI